jgi:hypothetical protein|tara:strand:+ start:207 stop:827 length:621 start_codon:yes stop_codon:yes gene_type:complete
MKKTKYSRKLDFAFINKTRTPEWRKQRLKELKELNNSNAVSEKLKSLKNPSILTQEHYEFLYEGMTVKYMKAKEAALVAAHNQMSEYMMTIDEQSDTILFLKADLTVLREVQETYYDRIIEWVEVVKNKDKELKKVWSDRNSAVRAYNGLIQLQKSAEDLGIDTKNFVLPEEDKAKWRDYQFSVNGKLLESGRTAYQVKVKPKDRK